MRGWRRPKEVRRLFPFLQRIVADGGYQVADTACAVRQAASAPLEIVKRPDAAKGFVVLPKRWIVERTFGWLNRCRRLAVTSSTASGPTSPSSRSA